MGPSTREPGAAALADERVTEWLDARLDGPTREAFEAELEGDPALRDEARALEEIVGLLRRLPIEEAPPDFADAVKSRIRRRTRGRFFGVRVRYRFPYEAVVNGILVALLLAVYLMAMPIGDMPPITPQMISQKTAPESVGSAILERYGDVEVDKVVASGGAVVMRVTLDADRVDDLEREIGLYPVYDIIGAAVAADDGRMIVHVLVPMRPRGP